MKSIFLNLIVSILLFASCKNSETVHRYYGKDYSEVSKEQAYVEMILKKKGNVWHGVETYAKTGNPKSEGDYVDMDIMKPVGSFKNYDEEGILKNISVYSDSSRIRSKISFYKNGNKQSSVIYNEDGTTIQTAWDMEGNELKDFIVERDAQYPGGQEAWINYINNNLIGTRLANAGVPAGSYKISLRFTVDTSGRLTEIKATTVPDCKRCEYEAENAAGRSAKWIPAIENNKLVKSSLMQPVLLQIQE